MNPSERNVFDLLKQISESLQAGKVEALDHQSHDQLQRFKVFAGNTSVFKDLWVASQIIRNTKTYLFSRLGIELYLVRFNLMCVKMLSNL